MLRAGVIKPARGGLDLWQLRDRRAADGAKGSPMTTLNPYVTFDGNARAAMEFYRDVFGGQLSIDTFDGYVPDETPAEQKQRIMHSSLATPNGLTLMGADTAPGMPFSDGARITISLSGPQADDADLRRYWAGLADGGTVTMPLEIAPWGHAFGALTDRNGVSWFVNIGDQD